MALFIEIISYITMALISVYAMYVIFDKTNDKEDIKTIVILLLLVSRTSKNEVISSLFVVISVILLAISFFKNRKLFFNKTT